MLEPAEPAALTAGGSIESPAAVHTSGAPNRTAGSHIAPASPEDSLKAAEARYNAARVAVGVAALRQRHGAHEQSLQAALRERAEAKRALDTLHRDPHPSATGDSHELAAVEDVDDAAAQDRCSSCGQYQGNDHRCPTPAGLPDAAYGDLKGDARVHAMVADLEQSVKSIMESGQLTRWLNAMASNGLQRWSPNNRLLAAMQMLQRGKDLDNLHMMGFRQWEAQGRKVSKGAKAVWILAPITRKVVDEADDGTEVERHRVVGFKSIPVFDISDTHGDPLPPSPAGHQTGTVAPGTLEGLRDRVGTAGYSYEETEIPGFNRAAGTGTYGYTEPATKRIVVDARQTPTEKASTLAHELAHVHCGHVDNLSEYRQHRGRMETEAEMTAYLVNRSRGMAASDAASFSPGYIAGWSKGDPKVMHAAMDTAVRAYNKIMEGSWPEGSQQ